MLNSLIDLLKSRRSRRVGLGMAIPDGPFRFESRYPPTPLDISEEAQLAFAAAGITGAALCDLDFSRPGGGNIMGGKIGRTTPSGDALQSVSLCVINDEGAFLVKRPRELSPDDLRRCVQLMREGRWSDLYRHQCVRIADRRPVPPKEPLFNLPVNHWSANAPGSTMFLPVNDLTCLYINGLLEILNEQTGAFVLDERKQFRPAGLARFARSRGGHLDDDVKSGKVVTIRHVENLVTEFISIEQGMMLQNLALMTEALGLGGFPHFANHEFGWAETLDFKLLRMPAGDYLGAGKIAGAWLSLTGRNPEVPYPVGLERDGTVLLKSFTPHYYGSMKDAVLAVVHAQIGPSGVFRTESDVSPWKSESSFNEGIAPISEKAIDATIAYCEYLWNNYGRFPAYHAPYRTVMAFQTAHVDVEFYDRFFKSEVLTEQHRRNFEKNTGAGQGI